MNFGINLIFLNHDPKNRYSLSIMVFEKQLHALSSLKMKATSTFAPTFSCDLLALQPSDSNAEKSASDPKDILNSLLLRLNILHSKDFEVYSI